MIKRTLLLTTMAVALTTAPVMAQEAAPTTDQTVGSGVVSPSSDVKTPRAGQLRREERREKIKSSDKYQAAKANFENTKAEIKDWRAANPGEPLPPELKAKLDKAEAAHDEARARREGREDKRDAREDTRDAKHEGGPRDAREDKRDTRRDARDARGDGRYDRRNTRQHNR